MGSVTYRERRPQDEVEDPFGKNPYGMDPHSQVMFVTEDGVKGQWTEASLRPLIRSVSGTARHGGHLIQKVFLGGSKAILDSRGTRLPLGAGPEIIYLTV